MSNKIQNIKPCNPKHPRNSGHNERPYLRIIRTKENEDFQLKSLENVFNKILKENFPNLKKEMTVKVQEAYRTEKKGDQKRKSSCHIIIKTLDEQNK